MSKKKTKTFYKSPKARKLAVEIAKDVISQVKAGRLVAAQCYGYVVGDFADTVKDTFYEAQSKSELDLQKLIKRKMTKKNPCTVCGIGSLFISKVNKFNNFNIASCEISRPQIVKGLEEVFSKKELDYIEAVFENHMSISKETAGISDELESIYPDPNDKLIAMMESIIRNNGVYVLEIPARVAKSPY